MIQMSDCYQISLDQLLKGEDAAADYLNYLTESTNTVKSKHTLSLVILLMTYLGIWSIALIVFWVFSTGSDAMGYGIMFLWILLPVTTFFISFLIGKNNYWRNWKWLLCLVFGIMYMLADYTTFRLANMIAFETFRMPQWILLPIGAIISLVGMGIGAVFSHFFVGKKQNQHEGKE